MAHPKELFPQKGAFWLSFPRGRQIRTGEGRQDQNAPSVTHTMASGSKTGAQRGGCICACAQAMRTRNDCADGICCGQAGLDIIDKSQPPLLGQLNTQKAHTLRRVVTESQVRRMKNGWSGTCKQRSHGLCATSQVVERCSTHIRLHV